MKIGELSQRTDTPVRMLRYYEEQGLIHSERLPNGYRIYEDYVVDRVRQVRGLLEVGLPTRIIKQILPCLDSSRAIYLPYVTPDMIATLEHERDRMAEKIECLTKNHRAINDYLDAVSRDIRDS
ncbi:MULTISPECIES: MerR family transcriptional regulator [Actinomadura]|uniref:MerR family DNA-binding transcriptional regulator n=1 Tax=Actinomadura litoris TaxID=2678616 RepID=A0A7K1L1D2_9ACTN|nr:MULTISPECIES: MerR family transcriptional regulator [Actinomadura]MBT2206699.1 MerR family transcriptional regulator [Actinomadura sp. NEAU-AAG7]MUN38202.1 MerR family DNA-binding transcriptional regulator [Actinomadura litoris]